MGVNFKFEYYCLHRYKKRYQFLWFAFPQSYIHEQFFSFYILENLKIVLSIYSAPTSATFRCQEDIFNLKTSKIYSQRLNLFA